LKLNDPTTRQTAGFLIPGGAVFGMYGMRKTLPPDMPPAEPRKLARCHNCKAERLCVVLDLVSRDTGLVTERTPVCQVCVDRMVGEAWEKKGN
jgi:hypothetical protein